jgi:indole-3-glycerol phosphate synthase
MVTRLRQCDERITAGRLRKAEQFLDAAEAIRDLADDEAETGDAFVTLCIHAGIAASDAICCRGLGHFVQGDDHNQAIAQLSRASPGGGSLSNDLRALLQMKNRAEYGADSVSADQRKRAWRRAENLVEAARSRL